jgi:hypothetical protein
MRLNGRILAIAPSGVNRNCRPLTEKWIGIYGDRNRASCAGSGGNLHIHLVHTNQIRRDAFIVRSRSKQSIKINAQRTSETDGSIGWRSIGGRGVGTPIPVPYNETISPGAALFAGEFSETPPSEETFKAASCPQPLPSAVKRDGLTR